MDGRGVDKMTMVIQEIMQDKIYLDMSGKLQTNEATEELEGGRGNRRSYPVHRMSRPGLTIRKNSPAGPQGLADPPADEKAASAGLRAATG